MRWDAVKRPVEPLLVILLLHVGNIGDLADVDGADPAAGVGPVHLGVGLRVRLGRVADADEFAAREPAVDLGDAVGLVGLRALGQRLQEAGEDGPGTVAEDEGARLVVLADKSVEEWVEVVGRGREVEPYGIAESVVDLLVELAHAWDGLGLVCEGCLEDADRVGGLGDLDGIVDVGDDAPSFGTGEVDMSGCAECRDLDFDIGAVRLVAATGELDLGADTTGI